jgi:nucleotide-binding universal stress UspA family protein
VILIAYDGSAEGRRAIAVAAQRLAGPAMVLHVLPQVVRAPLTTDAMTGSLGDEEAFAAHAQRLRARAELLAAEGAQLARQAGLAAEPLVVEAATHRVWRAIVEVAEAHDVQMIVLGHRSATGLRTSLPGSVSRGVVAHSLRPVVVVPTAPGSRWSRGRR